ncbi:MAG TPA: sugar ABC transporter ATP-binding protein [Polyangiaceae bacterium]|nr:sugar ABC transporter ATP-binding protein [Polyangiaceae bacterium]
MLSARGVGKAFGATRALASVDLEAGAGEVHAVVGENGAGKSTLMKVLAGVVGADEGAITLGGSPFRPRSPAAARRAGVALVSQEVALCPHLDVAANLALGQEPTRFGVVERARVESAARAALAEVGAGRIDPRARAGDLPLADRQLVEIARALVRWGDRPGAPPPARVLILDEPTSSLGREDARRLFALVRRLRGEGLLVLYISHFLEEVAAVADRYTVLRDGRSVASGAMRDVTPADLVEKMAGRRVEGAAERAPRAPGEVVLELGDLAGAAKPARASLALRRGEIFGVAGLVGAGRTELLRAIFGLDPVRSGTVRVKSWAGPATPRERLAQGLGLLSEDRAHEGLALARSVAENVTLSKLEPLAPFRGAAARLAAALGLVSPARADEAAARWAGELGIKCRGPGQAAAELSGGNQQKLALARLLHHDVDVLLLDEPARGIDVGAKAQIFGLIDGLARRGKAVLLVSSYLPELLSTCDRIAVLCRGVLGEARPASSWSEHELLEQATGAAARREAPGAPAGAGP